MKNGLRVAGGVLSEWLSPPTEPTVSFERTRTHARTRDAVQDAIRAMADERALTQAISNEVTALLSTQQRRLLAEIHLVPPLTDNSRFATLPCATRGPIDLAHLSYVLVVASLPSWRQTRLQPVPVSSVVRRRLYRGAALPPRRPQVSESQWRGGR